VVQKHSSTYLYLKGLFLAQGLALTFFLAATATCSSLTIAWDRNAETNVVAYVVYYGQTANVYTGSTNVGNVTQVSLDNPPWGHWFLAVTAVTDAGDESDFSAPLDIYLTPSLTNSIPGFSLLGANPLYLPWNASFVDPGFATSDINLLGFPSPIHVSTSSDVNPQKVGTYYIQYVVTTFAGLQLGSVFRQVVVQDLSPPYLVGRVLGPNCCPDLNVTITNAGPGQAVAPFFALPPFVDDCDSNVAVICDPPGHLNFSVGVTPVVCLGIDFSGNWAQCSFNVRVVDAPNRVLTIVQGAGGKTVEVTWMGESAAGLFLESAEINPETVSGGTLNWQPLANLTLATDGKVIVASTNVGRLFRVRTIP
jgi:Domain of unknown function (DUF5011)/HYR domain